MYMKSLFSLLKKLRFPNFKNKICKCIFINNIQGNDRKLQHDLHIQHI